MKRTIIIAFISLLSYYANAQWADNFETYTAGTWPYNYTADGNGTDISSNYIDNSVAYSGSKSLHVFGILGGCWGTLAYRNVNIMPPYELKLMVRNGNEVLNGCHPNRAFFGLRQGTYWGNPSRSFMVFRGSDTIESSGAQVHLGSYTTLEWYEIKVRYERPDVDSVKLSYWINGDFKGSETLKALPSENMLSSVELAVDEGTAWYDNVVLINSNSSISFSENNNLFKLYPTLAKDIIYVECELSSVIEIINTKGLIIKTIYTSNQLSTVPISDIPGGYYFIKLTTVKGIAISKFVKC
jgi:hypothetical protein